MLRFARYSPAVVFLVFSALVCAKAQSVALERQSRDASLESAQALPSSPRALYQALNTLRPDSSRVYTIKSLNLRRDVINITFDEGKLAFLQPIGGRVTGIIFAGRGHVIAMPHDAGERRSLAEFVGLPILDQTFYRAFLRFDDRTADEIANDLTKTGAKGTRDADFTANWEPIFASGNSWQSLRIMEDFLSTAPMPYFYAGVLTDTKGQVDLLLDNRLSEQVLIGQPKILSGGVPAFEVWTSFRALDSTAGSSDVFVPVDYRIQTNIADDLSLDGTTFMHLKAVRSGQRVLRLELSRKLIVGSVKDENGASLTYFQNEDLSKHQISIRGNDAVLVVLPAPVEQGHEVRVEISYRGRVVSDAGNGVDYVGEHETWYAHPVGTSYFALFDLSFRWPKRLKLVATGRNLDLHDDGDFEAGRWVSGVPFAVAGFNLGEYQVEMANASDPRIDLYANRELEDAIMARLHQAPLHVPVPSDSAPIQPDRVEGPASGPASVLKNLGHQVMESIRFYENLDGQFPFADLEISQIPGNVGQGWPGLVYLSTLAFLPPETQERAGFAQVTQELAREVMPFHEVAHQWWGNVAVAATYRDVWIEEGMANYQALLYADARQPDSHRMKTWLARYRTDLLAKAPEGSQTIEEAGPLIMGYRLESTKDPLAYNRVIYDKGTWVMHMIREMLHDSSAADPDARFRAFLRDVLTQYRFKPFSTADFERLLEQHMTPSMDLEGGHSMSWFFDEWVNNTGIPHYTIQFEAKPRGHEYVVTGKIHQTDVDDLFTEAVPIYASQRHEKLERLGTVVTTGPDTPFRFISQFRPVHLVVDPYLTLLCRTD